jgi:lipoprotein-anchoring transpeptidase ErfK/SrfK
LGRATGATSTEVNSREAAAQRYEAVKARGAPIAVLMRPTVLRAAPGGRPIVKLKRRTEFGSPRVYAIVGRRSGWLRVIASQLPNNRRGWIPQSATSLVANQWAVEADISSRRVTVLKHGRVVYRFTVGVGKPSTPTPPGIYAVTDKLELLGGPSGYGCCALALSGHQPHIAQGWSGGDRLAILGTSEQNSIGRAASFGCLRARDRDIRWVVNHVFLGTLVEIRP